MKTPEDIERDAIEFCKSAIADIRDGSLKYIESAITFAESPLDLAHQTHNIDEALGWAQALVSELDSLKKHGMASRHEALRARLAASKAGRG